MDEENEKEVVEENITKQNMELAALFESTAFLVQETGKRLSERMEKVAKDTQALSDVPYNFVFNAGILVGELDQVLEAMRGYLKSYNRFRTAYLTDMQHEKEKVH